MTHFAVLKDKNLKPENIKKGVKIFKVTGTFAGGVRLGGSVRLDNQ